MTNPIMPKLYASWISPPIKSAAFKSELRRSFEKMIDAAKVKTKSMIIIEARIMKISGTSI